MRSTGAKHNNEDYRLINTVMRIRSELESADTEIIRWVRGRFNLSHALTKRNVGMSYELNRFLTGGKWTLQFPHTHVRKGIVSVSLYISPKITSPKGALNRVNKKGLNRKRIGHE